jgi:RNA polymerase sigma-70 factor (ECF subfamily)
LEQGRTPSIEEVCTASEPFVRALALRYAPVPSMADDFVQRVFLEFVRRRDRWDLTRPVEPLLAGIARNIGKQMWEERRRHLSRPMLQLSEHIHSLIETRGETGWVEPADRQALRECLEKLPEKSRKIIHAHYFLGVTCQKIGEQIGVTTAAVRQALCRLRKRLLECIEGFTATSEGGVS